MAGSSRFTARSGWRTLQPGEQVCRGGRLEEALALAEQVLADYERVLGVDHPDTLSARHNLANRCAGVGRLEEALALAEQVLADRERVLGVDNPNTLSSGLLVAFLAGDGDSDS